MPLKPGVHAALATCVPLEASPAMPGPRSSVVRTEALCAKSTVSSLSCARKTCGRAVGKGVRGAANGSVQLGKARDGDHGCS